MLDGGQKCFTVKVISFHFKHLTVCVKYLPACTESGVSTRLPEASFQMWYEPAAYAAASAKSLYRALKLAMLKMDCLLLLKSSSPPNIPLLSPQQNKNINDVSGQRASKHYSSLNEITRWELSHHFNGGELRPRKHQQSVTTAEPTGRQSQQERHHQQHSRGGGNHSLHNCHLKPHKMSLPSMPSNDDRPMHSQSAHIMIQK